MKALLLARLLLPLIAAAVIGIAVWLVFVAFAGLILWGTVALVPVFTGACLLWRRRIVRDEATPPFATGPEPQPGATRSLERPVVAGVVISSEELAR